MKGQLEVDGRRIAVNDFSKTGFEAPLPEAYQTVGKTGDAILRFSAVGYDIEQEIAFEVVRVTANGNVGATFTVLKGSHKPSAS